MQTHWRDILEPAIRGQKFLVALNVLAQTRGLARFLDGLGAGSLFAIGAGRGTGILPEPTLCSSVDLGLPPAPDMITGIREAEAALRDLPPSVQERIDAWDPEGGARVISTIFGEGTDIAGRSQLGGRRAEWLALEDKTQVDALWDDAGVPRAPSILTSARDFGAAIDALSGENGAVVAGDSREGFNGGAVFVRWIRRPEDRAEAEAFFGAHCDTVRVMPFLDGLPCSIHGIVFPDCTVGFRPVEMLVLRRPDNKLQYAGAASFWNAGEDVTQSMRAMVESVGEHLRQRVDFRGAFTIDGVLTADGFLPTELNPRLGAALPRLFHAIDTNLSVLNRCIIEGLDFDWRPRALQAAVLESTESTRSGHGMLMSARRGLDAEVWVRFEGSRCVVCTERRAQGHIRIGPGPTGSIVFLSPSTEHTPIGPSLAPRIARMAACADALWGLGIGPLKAASLTHL